MNFDCCGPFRSALAAPTLVACLRGETGGRLWWFVHVASFTDRRGLLVPIDCGRGLLPRMLRAALFLVFLFGSFFFCGFQFSAAWVGWIAAEEEE